jgi:DNA polymerase-3 subunit epsilon
MVDNAPRQPGESDTVATYLGAIDNAVSDRILSFTEAIHLKDLAAALAIFEAEQADAHRTYLRTLASTAWTDHQLTDAERDDLLAVGKLLEVPEHEVDEAIADTMPRRQGRAASGSASVPQPAVASDQVAAWYPDPYGEAQLRWWDGSAWTVHLHD